MLNMFKFGHTVITSPKTGRKLVRFSGNTYALKDDFFAPMRAANPAAARFNDGAWEVALRLEPTVIEDAYAMFNQNVKGAKPSANQLALAEKLNDEGYLDDYDGLTAFELSEAIGRAASLKKLDETNDDGFDDFAPTEHPLDQREGYRTKKVA